MSDRQVIDYSVVQESSASPAIYDKMVHDEPLSVGDVIGLTRARVPEGVTIRYIKDHRTSYILNQSDIDAMHQNGVPSTIIDYMVNTGNLVLRNGY